ncbi:MAG: FHA domain-containing protein [Deltaproteobacteria bacterium]|nr:FHA domain-containing protein [Deltaproteobacteria bacterium]MBN2672632.1 FHA domain-containing protein [Deltaproteobacteria bacterium]
MAIKLTIRDQRNIDEEFSRTFVQHKVTLGRARYCDICLPDLTVSTSHVEIRLMGNDFCAVDTGSLNGTYLGKKKLVAHRPRKLSNNDVLIVSHFEISFQLGVSSGPVPEKNVAQNQALTMLESVLAMAPVEIDPALVVLSGPGKASRFVIPPAPSICCIGRSRQADIRLDDNDVSRRHAEVIYENGSITVRDLGSRNGILCNGESAQSVVLTQGSAITLGNTTLALEHPLDPSLDKIQSAPEEETASFCASPEEPLPAKEPVPEPGKTDQNELNFHPNASKSIKIPPDLPFGPADPLAPKDTSDYVKTQELPVAPGEKKSDLGLIVVGAIIVVLCVAVLIWLLT